ncbi:MAG: alpha/beta hydrolase [Meiothermus sp.]
MGFYRQGKRRLFYTEQGSGPPVILIHGLSGSRLWWRRNVPVLAREFRVYTVDLVGFGRSWRQSILPFAESAALLASWMQELELKEPRLVGHSMGAHTALYVAAVLKEQIGALVLVAASTLVHGEWWRMATRLPLAGVNGALDFLPTLVFDALRAGPLNLYRATQAILHDDPTQLLAEVTAPTLLVWGERDVLVPGTLGEQMRAGIIGSRLEVIGGAGHNVMYDRAAEFNRLVLPFLRDPKGTESRGHRAES